MSSPTISNFKLFEIPAILFIHKFDFCIRPTEAADKAYFRKTTKNALWVIKYEVLRPSGDEKGINFIIYRSINMKGKVTYFYKNNMKRNSFFF